MPGMVASIPTWPILAVCGFGLAYEKRLLWLLRLLSKLLMPSHSTFKSMAKGSQRSMPYSEAVKASLIQVTDIIQISLIRQGKKVILKEDADED